SYISKRTVTIVSFDHIKRNYQLPFNFKYVQDPIDKPTIYNEVVNIHDNLYIDSDNDNSNIFEKLITLTKNTLIVLEEQKKTKNI
ncbi:12570_t:CDS:1, partial [Gigaspora margarita]